MVQYQPSKGSKTKFCNFNCHFLYELTKIDHSIAKVEARSSIGKWTWNMCAFVPRCQFPEVLWFFNYLDNICGIIMQSELIVNER